MHFLRLFIVVLLELHCLPSFLFVLLVVAIRHQVSLHYIHLLVSEMYCLRLFIVVLQELYSIIIVVYLLKTMCIPSFRLLC